MPTSPDPPSAAPEGSLRHRLLLPPGPVDLSDIDTRSTPGWDEGSNKKAKKKGKRALADLGEPLEDAQEKLFAHGQVTGDDAPRVLLVLQGMDTSGKGGIVRDATGHMDPMGIEAYAFKAPTEEELEHDFLWRVERRLPGPGMIGIFDRSHYEDVLIAKVDGLADDAEVERRYEQINAFEQRLVDDGVVLVKVMLHISVERQAERLLQRLEDPTKHWKFDPSDLDARRRWADYQRAYETALERCRSDDAPWLVVPADRKWYRKLAVATVLLETLEAMGLDWPPVDYDVEEQKRRLLEDDGVLYPDPVAAT